MPKEARFLGESVVRGLRLEPDLARALRQYAQAQAQAHGVEVNIASAARTLLRQGLNVARGEHNCRREGYFAGLAEARKKIAGALK
jgi:hypothetical protein